MAQLDAYMILEAKGIPKLDPGPIPGETTDQEMSELKAIPITSFSLAGGFDNTASDRGEATDNVPDLSETLDKLTLRVVKNLDGASPALMLAYCSHMATAMNEAKPFSKLTIIVRKAGDLRKVSTGTGPAYLTQRRYLQMTFEDVYLTSYDCGGQHNSNLDMPTENLAFVFKRIQMEYLPQKSTGKMTVSSKTVIEWDFFPS